MEDVLTIAYEGEYLNDISILMVSHKTDKGLEILNVFEKEEADELYQKLIGKKIKEVFGGELIWIKNELLER